MLNATGQSENQLVVRAQGGDEVATQELVDRLRQPLNRFLFRRLGTAFAPQFDDIQQDVLTKVFLTLDRFDVERGIKFTTWVYTYARNHCIDLLKRKRLPVVPMESGGEVFAIADRQSISPVRNLEQSELREQIDAAIATISPRHRDVFVLRERGMRYAEIARRLGVGEGTIKSRLRKARISLQRKLARFDRERTVA